MILVQEGQCPVILCLPHNGTKVPEVVAKRFNATGRLQADLSWQLDRVFDFHKELDVTVVRSSISRYVIDVDKDPVQPSDKTAEPSNALCPILTLDGKRIYQQGEEPGPTEIEQRSLLFYMPFHRALKTQIDRLARMHRRVIVLDCQSMRSNIRGITAKELPIINVGSLDGTSCSPELRNLLVGSFNAQHGFSASVDQHTKGGFITQSFGRPDRNLHALSLLLAQRAYVRHESPPFEPDKTKIARLKTILSDSLSRVVEWANMDGDTGTAPSPTSPRDMSKPADAGSGGSAALQTKPSPAKASQGANPPLLVAE